MQILCHRKDRKVGKEIKMLGRGVGRILSWVGEYTPLDMCGHIHAKFENHKFHNLPNIQEGCHLCVHFLWCMEMAMYVWI